MWAERSSADNSGGNANSHASSSVASTSGVRFESTLTSEQHDEYLRLTRKLRISENFLAARTAAAAAAVAAAAVADDNASTSTAVVPTTTPLSINEQARLVELRRLLRDEQRAYHAAQRAECNMAAHKFLDARIEWHLSVRGLFVVVDCL